MLWPPAATRRQDGWVGPMTRTQPAKHPDKKQLARAKEHLWSIKNPFLEPAGSVIALSLLYESAILGSILQSSSVLSHLPLAIIVRQEVAYPLLSLHPLPPFPSHPPTQDMLDRILEITFPTSYVKDSCWILDEKGNLPFNNAFPPQLPLLSNQFLRKRNLKRWSFPNIKLLNWSRSFPEGLLGRAKKKIKKSMHAFHRPFFASLLLSLLPERVQGQHVGFNLGYFTSPPPTPRHNPTQPYYLPLHWSTWANRLNYY